MSTPKSHKDAYLKSEHPTLVIPDGEDGVIFLPLGKWPYADEEGSLDAFPSEWGYEFYRFYPDGANRPDPVRWLKWGGAVARWRNGLSFYFFAAN